jgi:hypothetical protein
MARTKGCNKSQSIRDFFAENPTAKAKEVVAGLAEKGIKVNVDLVYVVKGGMKEKKRRKKRFAKAAMAAASKGSSSGVTIKTDAVTMIREVRSLAEKAGGYSKLKDLVDALVE